MCFLWKNFSILNWSDDKPLSLSIFSRQKNFIIIKTYSTICLQAADFIHDMPFDEGCSKGIRQAWKTIVHATFPSDSWKTIDCIKFIFFILANYMRCSLSPSPLLTSFDYCCMVFHKGQTNICKCYDKLYLWLLCPHK